jgi:hypothetical protein
VGGHRLGLGREPPKKRFWQDEEAKKAEIKAGKGFLGLTAAEKQILTAGTPKMSSFFASKGAPPINSLMLTIRLLEGKCSHCNTVCGGQCGAVGTSALTEASTSTRLEAENRALAALCVETGLTLPLPPHPSPEPSPSHSLPLSLSLTLTLVVSAGCARCSEALTGGPCNCPPVAQREDSNLHPFTAEVSPLPQF